MNRIKKLIQEMHRRSLWQVVGIYLVAGWGALQVVDTMTGALGLPDWFPPFALALLVIGFPVVLATAFVQEGIRGSEARSAPLDAAGASVAGPTAARRPGLLNLLRWRNALGGGVLAFALWGVVATVWLLGGGPGGRMLAADDDLAAIAARAEAELPAVAVLPFSDMSPESDFAFFADGVHEDILTNLSKLRSLLVLSRTSVLKYRDTDKTVKQIAEELGANAVLEGSVRRFQNQVRITAQLIDATTDTHLWAETYDRSLDNIFQVQSDIALAVARALDATFSPEEERRIQAVPTADLAAYDLYLEGRAAYNRYLADENQRAIDLFRQALARDPTLALAWAGLADGWSQLVNRFDGGREWADSALAASRRAVELAPEMAEGHKALGFALSVRGEEEAAIEEYELALSFDPNSHPAANNLGVSLTNLGRFPEAIRWFKFSERVEPHTFSRVNLAVAYTNLGFDERAERWIQADLRLVGDNRNNLFAGMNQAYFRGDRAAVPSLLERYLQTERAQPSIHNTTASFALWLGDLDLAEREALESQRLGSIPPEFAYKSDRTILGELALRRGDEAEGRRILGEARDSLAHRLSTAGPTTGGLLQLGVIHALLGDANAAFESLERAYQRGANQPWVLEREGALESVRADPRYVDLTRRMRADWERMREQVLANERHVPAT